MGKKLNSSSIKISKHEEKRQLNNLIKGLRPKVFITDSSSFKNLVQELTGVETKANYIQPPINLPTVHHQVESQPITEIQDDGVFPESSFEFSLDSGSNSSGNQETEFSNYRDIESWLLDIDQFQNTYDTYASLVPEACVYDYDLSGFM